jgi:hypothetical protein
VLFYCFVLSDEAKSAVFKGENRRAQGHECARCETVQSPHKLVYRELGVERERRGWGRGKSRGEEGRGREMIEAGERGDGERAMIK